ncbi:MAG: efflux RND transporter permease subunit [Opitutales bacterium]
MSGPGPNIERAGIIGWFAQNSIAANILMFGLLLGGWHTMSNTNSDLFPEIDPRTITVSVKYGGASPEEIASSITQRAEDAILGLEGIKRVSSKAVEGLGTVTVELTDFADARTVADEVQSAIDGLVDFPPEDAGEAEVSVTTVASNVARLVVTGAVDELALRKAAESLERDLLMLDDISTVTLQGARNYEISIEVSQATLRQYEISIDQVSNTIRSASVNLSGGTLRTSAGNILLRTDQEVKNAADFAEIEILTDAEGRSVSLGDIATIRDGFEDAQLINTYNGEPAVFLQISRSSNEDSITVADAAKAFLATYQPVAGISVFLVGDQTEVIRDRINLLMRNAIMGLALVFVFLALTLDLRLAFWTCVGIPVAFLGGFILFGQFTTINMTMLLGLIMVLGLVVDDAIVVGENIYERQERGEQGLRAAVLGSTSVAAPVTVGVLTTIAVFAPLLFSSGMLGQITRPVPLVAIAVLIISLIEVFFILPSHMSHGGDWTTGPMKRVKAWVTVALNRFRDTIIIPATRFSVRMPYLVIAAGISLFIASLGLLSGGHLRFVFFPVVEGEEIKVNLEMPKGTSFEQTERTMDKIIAAGYQAIGGQESPLYRSLSVTIGGELTSGFGAEGTQVSSEIASATLELAPAGERAQTAAEIESLWRESLGELAGVRSLTFASEGLSGGDDLSFNLSHSNDTNLVAAVAELEAALKGINGVVEIENTGELGSRQLEFSLTPEGISAGLTVSELAKQVRQAFYGEEVQRIQRDGNEVLVFVRLPEAGRRSLADLASMQINLPNGTIANLRTVAEVGETRSPASINRVDGRRIITVSADVDENITTPNDVTAFLEANVLGELESKFPGLYLVQDGQARDQAEDIRVLAGNLLIGIMIMYALLSSQLRSYTQPLIILFAIPFGAVGAILGHYALGFDLSFLSLFGMVALAGVVVNDSVVLIDYFNQLQKEGKGTKIENILSAVERRFRPIFITTLTTFLGLLPMISETSVQARFLIPMALSVAFGILFASFVILILVPACLALGKQSATAISNHNQ